MIENGGIVKQVFVKSEVPFLSVWRAFNAILMMLPIVVLSSSHGFMIRIASEMVNGFKSKLVFGIAD